MMPPRANQLPAASALSSLPASRTPGLSPELAAVCAQPIVSMSRRDCNITHGVDM